MSGRPDPKPSARRETDACGCASGGRHACGLPGIAATPSLRTHRIVDRTATKRALLRYRSCLACGQSASNGHHVLPIGRGRSGDDVVANIVSLCGSGASGDHGAFHGAPYTAVIATTDAGSPRIERRDREWVARRIGERLQAQRPDVVAYVLAKLGDVPGREFLRRVYYLDLL